jgi:hypothetical protein
MAAQLSFADRVAVLNQKIITITEGDLTVFECENGVIDIDYKGVSLFALNTKGKTEKTLINTICAIYSACLSFAIADDFEELGIDPQGSD